MTQSLEIGPVHLYIQSKWFVILNISYILYFHPSRLMIPVDIFQSLSETCSVGLCPTFPSRSWLGSRHHQTELVDNKQFVTSRHHQVPGAHPIAVPSLMIPIDITCHNWGCPTITPPLRQDKALKSAWPEKPWFGTGWGEMAAESCPASRKGIEAFDLETLRKKVAIGWRNNFNKKLLRFALVPVEFFLIPKSLSCFGVVVACAMF